MTEPLRIDFEKLDALMADRAWDLAELSRQSGVHRVTIYALRRGDTPARRTIRRIAEALGVVPSAITTVVDAGTR